METKRPYIVDDHERIDMHVPDNIKPMFMLMRRRSLVMDLTWKELMKNNKTKQDINMYHLISNKFILRITLKRMSFDSEWNILIFDEQKNITHVIDMGTFRWSSTSEDTRVKRELDMSIFGHPTRPRCVNGVLIRESKIKEERTGHLHLLVDEAGYCTMRFYPFLGDSIVDVNIGHVHNKDLQSVLLKCLKYKTYMYHDKMKWLFNEFFALLLTAVACCRLKQMKKKKYKDVDNCIGPTIDDKNGPLINRFKEDYDTCLDALLHITEHAYVETLKKARFVFIVYFTDRTVETHDAKITEAYDEATLSCFCQHCYSPDCRPKQIDLVNSSSSKKEYVLDGLFLHAKMCVPTAFCMCDHFSNVTDWCAAIPE